MPTQADSTFKYVMFSSALAILKCPMPVEDKISILTMAIEAEIKELEYMPLIPITGLKSFDDAMDNLTNTWV